MDKKRGRFLRWLGVFVVASLFIIPGIAFSAPGDFDTTFNSPNGFVLYNGTGNAADAGQGVAVQSDGKIVVVGSTYNGSDYDVLVLRYNTDGTLDTAFNSSGLIPGVVTYDGGVGDDYGYGVAIQADGKIVVVGKTRKTDIFSNSSDDVLVLRYNTDGTLDAANFGTGGIVTYASYSTYDDVGYGVAIQSSDGKIVVAGSASDFYGSAPIQKVLVLRYNTGGTLDNTFGSNGVVTYGGGNYNNNYGYGVGIQSNGTIVVVGQTDQSSGSLLLILRYNAVGASSGYTNISSGDYNIARGVVVQPDDKVVIVGSTNGNGDKDVWVLRYNSDSYTPDDTFAGYGNVTYDGGSDEEGYGVAVQSNGKIVVVGITDPVSSDSALVLRYNTDGTLDDAFGTGGVVTSRPGGVNNQGYGVAIQPSDGKIVVVGNNNNINNDDVLTMRLLGGGDGDDEGGIGAGSLPVGPLAAGISAFLVWWKRRKQRQE